MCGLQSYTVEREQIQNQSQNLLPSNWFTPEKPLNPCDPEFSHLLIGHIQTHLLIVGLNLGNVRVQPGTVSALSAQ